MRVQFGGVWSKLEGSDSFLILYKPKWCPKSRALGTRQLFHEGEAVDDKTHKKYYAPNQYFS